MSCVFDSLSAVIIVLETCNRSTRTILLKDVSFIKLFHSVVREISINFLENYNRLPFNRNDRNFLIKEKEVIKWLSRDRSRKHFQTFLKRNKKKILRFLKLADYIRLQLC